MHSEHGGPTIPMMVHLDKDLASKPSPSPKLLEITKVLDAYAGEIANSTEPLPALDLPIGFKWSDIHIEPYSILWPRGLYIPEDADWRSYWFIPPPSGQNRYNRKWTFGPNTGYASFKNGDFHAYAAARPIDPVVRSEAGIGFIFEPFTSLAIYSIEVTINLAAQNTYQVRTMAPAGGMVREWGGVYTAAWEINPVDGSLSLVQPYGLITLFDETFVNLSTTPTHFWGKAESVKTNMMFQGGRSYLIGVIAASQISNDWTMNNGQPMQLLPSGDVWKLWGSVGGNVPQVWVTPSVIYIP